MAKFLVLYLVPAKVMDDWSKTDPEKRKPAEDKMRAEWHRWMAEHASMITQTEAAGKTKRAAADGVADARNDIHLYSLVEAESHEAAAEAFKDHPHLQIPQSSIEITAVRSLTS